MPLTIETNFAAPTSASPAIGASDDGNSHVDPNEQVSAPLSPTAASKIASAPCSSTPLIAMPNLSLSANGSISSASTGIDSPSSCQSQSPLLSCSTPSHSPNHSPNRSPGHSHRSLHFASQRKAGSSSFSNSSSPHRNAHKESSSTSTTASTGNGTGSGGNGYHEPESRAQRLRHEINLTKELIDFDVIKGSAFFHTKPSLQNKKLLHQGFRRALLFPFCGSYWRSRMASGAFEFATFLYLFHLLNSLVFFLFSLPTYSSLNAFEICFPYLLLLLISFEYGRVSSTLQTSEAADGSMRLYSPTKQHANGASSNLHASANAHLHFAAAAAGMVVNSPSLMASTGTASLPSNSSSGSHSSIRSEPGAVAVGVAATAVPPSMIPASPAPPPRPRIQESILSPTSPTSAAATGFGSESENSDSTDSDHEDSDDSSSSSENEAPQDEFDVPVSPAENVMFPAAAVTTSPGSPNINSVHSNSNETAGVNAHHSGATSTRRRPTNRPTSSSIGSATAFEEEKESVDHLSRRRVAVCVWENGIPRKKFMSIPELRATILAKVKATPPRMIYRKIAHASAWILAIVPVFFRLTVLCGELECLGWIYEPSAIFEYLSELLLTSKPQVVALQVANLSTLICVSSLLATHYLASILFSALADAEVTYHRRFLYAKCFTSLTSARRSRLSNLPHFRLKNVVNIKAWISLRAGRSWLKRQGRQRVADEIVSTSFLINLCLLVVMGVQAVSDSNSGGNGGIQNQHLLHVEVSMWCMLSSLFMLRFMMLGSNINSKYQNTSLLLTEQMNVYLRLLVKPHKKDKLLVSNNVLKLASKLLKELNSPNKVSGITMNPLLYNITRVVLLSAFSSVASEFFGFKLKLWKMKSI